MIKKIINIIDIIIRNPWRTLQDVKVKDELKANHVKFTKEQLEELKLSIINHYQHRPLLIKKNLEEVYKKDLDDHLINRLKDSRFRYIPWLNSIKQIKNSNILEIGCGPGSSTLALAEQGAYVTAIDIDEGALQVAKDRIRIAKLGAEFHYANATEMKKLFGHKKFDFIIFFASIEHMTIEERVKSLRDAWSILPTDSFLVVIESPNRLWYDDSHTSLLPFFNWLPDKLAFKYSRYSSRIDFNCLFMELNEKSMIDFQRRGRGLSYHEFEIAIKKVDDLNIVSSLDEYESNDFLKFSSVQLNYLALLKNIKNDLQKGFCYPYINIIIRKD